MSSEKDNCERSALKSQTIDRTRTKGEKLVAVPEEKARGLSLTISSMRSAIWWADGQAAQVGFGLDDKVLMFRIVRRIPRPGPPPSAEFSFLAAVCPRACIFKGDTDKLGYIQNGGRADEKLN